MSDWLDEIENEATLALEGDEAFTGGYMDDLRMARVIRELVGYVAFLEGYCADRMPPEKARRRFRLPPDARELLDG